MAYNNDLEIEKVDPEDEDSSNPKFVGQVSADGDTDNDPEKVVDDAPDVEDLSDNQDATDLSEAQRLKDLIGKSKNPVTPTNNVSDLISKLLNGNNVDALKQAQEQAKGNTQFANLGIAANQIGAALGGPNGKLMDQVYQNQLKNADQPVKDLLAQQTMQGENLKQVGLADQVQSQLQKSDPTSSISQQYRQAVQDMTGHEVPETVSAQDLDKLSPIYEKMWQAKQNALNRQMMMGNKRDVQQQNAFFKVQSTLESARGNAAVQQAQKDMYATNKIDTLVNKYPDPNKMSPEQVQQLILEVSKVAQGGVPSDAEIKALMPQTLQSQAAKKWESLSNDPTPANAGAFIKLYKDYADDLHSTAQDIVNDKFNRVIETNKDHLAQQDYQNLKDKYLSPFQRAPQPAQNNKQQKPQPGQFINTKQGRFQVGPDGETLIPAPKAQ